MRSRFSIPAGFAQLVSTSLPLLAVCGSLPRPFKLSPPLSNCRQSRHPCDAFANSKLCCLKSISYMDLVLPRRKAAEITAQMVEW